MPHTYEFEMAMTCDGCANAAMRVLGKLGDAVNVESIDVSTKRIVVKTELPSQQVLDALLKTGKAVTLIDSR